MEETWGLQYIANMYFHLAIDKWEKQGIVWEKENSVVSQHETHTLQTFMQDPAWNSQEIAKKKFETHHSPLMVNVVKFMSGSM